ncbi:hypothetical protein C8R45DRAFT_936075 [Mycena sanguinolenta]|nr:hypothetical protein C8R45DRAFT_936075 [Mycena sanguinolenta]
MTNFIQLLPVNAPPTQYFNRGTPNPLATQPTPTPSQPTPSQLTPAPSQGTATSTPAPTPTGQTLFFHQGSTTAHLGLQQSPCADTVTWDDCLPKRATCPMPYHPDVGINHHEHSENAGCKFYVVCPGRVQGTYNTYAHPDEQVRGFRNGRALAVHNWPDAEKEWALGCLCWHSEQCLNVHPRVNMNTRVHLHPTLHAPPVNQWAVKGILKFFQSREEVFAAAATHNFHEVHILGSSDEAKLKAWVG